MSRGEQIRNRISDDYEKTPGYLLHDITEGCGQELDEMDVEIINFEKKFNVDNIEGDELTKFVLQRRGVVRKEAQYATGAVTVTGNGSVAVGDLFETENGIQFEAVESVTVTGSAEVGIIAKEPGNIGMVGANTITELPVTLEGIVSVNNESATVGGYDAETDAELRERYYFLMKNIVTSGNVASYKEWALEVEGVGAVKVFPLDSGKGTVTVLVIDSDKQPADATLVQAVQDALDPGEDGSGLGKAPIGATCTVGSATALDIDVEVTVTKREEADEDEIEEGIRNNIIEYLKSIAFDKDRASYAIIGQGILDVNGVEDYADLTLNGTTQSVQIPERKVAVLGEVVVTYA